MKEVSREVHENVTLVWLNNNVITLGLAHGKTSKYMKRLYEDEPDFEALIRIYSSEEGGRQHAPCNGIRWKFAYADDPMGEILYAIWPDFMDEDHNSLPTDVPLPIGVELLARMTVDIRGTREVMHRHRIFEGVRFFCHEQSRRVAEGRVTRITGLNHDTHENS